METALETRNLAAGYGKVKVVYDLNITVAAGEVVALLGANGAGKTTTIHTLAGFLPPLGGQVLFAGRPTTSSLHARVRSGLGLITEQRAVFMRMTIAENLRMARGDVDYALSLFPELVEHLSRRVGLLSGGQQQMLALARALSRRPSVLLADELSLGLSPIVVTRLLQAIRSAANEGIAVLLVEQYIHRVLDIADRGYVLKRGNIVLSGRADDLRSRVSEVQEMYF